MIRLFQIILFTLPILFSVQAFSQSPDNPFLNGELNLEFEGQITGLAGEIIEIKETKQKYPAYKLNLKIKGIKPIWVSSIAPIPGNVLKVGDEIIFKGYISSSSGIDSTGELEAIINSKSLLLALRAERP